jgi:uncharacterized Tic20 family protein
VPFHVRLLASLFVISGLLTILLGLSALALGVGAAALVPSAGANQFVAGLTAAAFSTLAFVALVWGGAHVGVGLPLGKHRRWARLAALVIGTVDLLLVPYGTLLGGYALWALLREDGRRLFE